MNTEPSEATQAEFENAALHQQRIADQAKGKVLCWHCNSVIAGGFKSKTLPAGVYCDEACAAARVEWLDDAARRADSRQTQIVQGRLGSGYVVECGELHLTGKLDRPISDANQTESEARATAEARNMPGLRAGSHWGQR